MRKILSPLSHRFSLARPAGSLPSTCRKKECRHHAANATAHQEALLKNLHAGRLGHRGEPNNQSWFEVDIARQPGYYT